MVTEVDERNGTVRTYWPNIRERVAAVEPEFARLVDELDLDKSYVFYLLYFPYGYLKGDTESSFIPRVDGSSYRLTDPNAPSEIVKHLGYGMKHAPLGMVLEKSFEFFIDREEERLTLPDRIYTPGSFLSIVRNLKNNFFPFNFTTNRIYSTCSGMRSTFMLPNVGCFTNHKNLKRDLNIRCPTPKSLYEHSKIFAQIANSPMIKSEWRSNLLYFPQKFITNLNNDKRWRPLNNYLTIIGFNLLKYDIIKTYHEYIYSVVQKRKNLKPNPYLMDTVKHLIAIMFGVIPGYSIAINGDYLPLDVIQKAYIEVYGLKKYIPSVVQPVYFDYEKDINPIYYSLQYPSTLSFSPKSRKLSGKLHELREIEHIVSSLMSEFASEKFQFLDSILHQISKKVEFKYFHNEKDSHNIVKQASEIPNLDSRLLQVNPSYKVEGSTFSVDSPFVRGCISIRAKEATG